MLEKAFGTEQAPITGEVIKQTNGDEQSAIDNVLSSIRLYSGLSSTKVQEASYPNPVENTVLEEQKGAPTSGIQLPSDSPVHLHQIKIQKHVAASIGDRLGLEELKNAA